MMPVTKRVEATRLGRAKGYLLKKSLSPKISGNFLAGEARAPPRIGPKTLPIDQTWKLSATRYASKEKTYQRHDTKSSRLH